MGFNAGYLLCVCPPVKLLTLSWGVLTNLWDKPSKDSSESARDSVAKKSPQHCLNWIRCIFPNPQLGGSAQSMYCCVMYCYVIRNTEVLLPNFLWWYFTINPLINMVLTRLDPSLLSSRLVDLSTADGSRCPIRKKKHDTMVNDG